MYKIEKKPFGFKLIFADTIEIDEMKRWADESKKSLAGQSGKFGVLVDMRTLRPLKPEVQAVMVEGQKEFKAKGMQRSAVALANSIIALQFRRLAQDSGIYQWERYIDGSKEGNWEKVAEAWIVNGTDPDK
ncbi:MAG TPA: hypothetical protein VMH23_11805 [Bacteroidota bacterium]|nr:hypothetical protein [Bacteroidota bacterium]